MQYLLSISDPVLAQKLSKHLQTLDYVQLTPISVFEGEFLESNKEIDFYAQFLSMLQFLSSENRMEIYRFLLEIVALELEKQTQYYKDTHFEDCFLANLDMKNYQENLKIIDSL